MDGFDAHGVADKGKGQHSSTYGFLDMGGASTQIAFEPGTQARKEHVDNLLSVNLRLLDGMDVHHPVFVTTWLGYGTNKARERYVDATVAKYLQDHPTSQLSSDSHNKPSVGSEKPMTVISDPCLPKSLLLTEARHSGYALQGTGDFKACLEHAAPLLNKESPCPDPPCLMGVHVPPIDFSVNHFIGISEYWYSTEDIWSLGGVYDFTTFEQSAIDYCSREWDSIVQDHSVAAVGGKVPDVHRLEMQCFKAAWIVNVLHDGIGIPRLAVDRGGEGTKANVTEDALIKAGEKGFAEAPTHFQSVNQINNVAVSWTLGRMVLEVTDSIPRSTSSISQHEHEEESGSPLFEWKLGHHDQSWSYQITQNVQHAYTRLNPIIVIALFVLAALIYYFGCSGVRFRFWQAFPNKPDRHDYGMVSMEEASDALDGGGNQEESGAISPRKSTNAIGRSLMPLRILASRAAALVHRHPPTSPGPASLLPLARVAATKPSRTTGPVEKVYPRPRPSLPVLRHVNSSPALFRGQPPLRASTLPISRSGSKLQMDLSTLHVDTGTLLDDPTAPLTPPARSGSPAWPLRMTPSPKSGSTTTRLNTRSHQSNTSSSDSEGYLSVPVGVSSSASNGSIATWDGGSPDILGVPASSTNATHAPDEKPVLRSRNSSYTNLGVLARNRGGHARQFSADMG